MNARNDESPLAREWPGAAPAYPLPSNPTEWEALREATLRTLERLLGEFPPRPSVPQATLISEETRDGYTLRTLHLHDGEDRIPAYLLIPTGHAGSRPGILYCHYHGGEYHLGKSEIFAIRANGAARGPELARAGYVVLAIDAPAFGERQGLGPSGPDETGSREELSLSKYYLWRGETFWGRLLRDDRIALDFLCSLANVDASRIGAVGMSMGSTRSWWLAAMDDRIACTVAVACLTRYEELIATQALIAHAIYYFVPGMLRHFDTEAVLSRIAPRPLRILLGDDDFGSPVGGARRLTEFNDAVYKWYGAAENFSATIYEGVGHVFTEPMWEETQSWLGRFLQPG